MKVIAQITQDLVMCEVSAAEIARLHGVAGRYGEGWDQKWMSVGLEHDMVSAFKAVDALRSFDKSQLGHLKDRIDGMTKAYDGILQAYEKLTLLDKLSEPEDLTKKS